MLQRINDFLTNKNNFWRELINYSIMSKFNNPNRYFSFRAKLTKYFAINRTNTDSILKIDIDTLFPKYEEIVFRQRLLPSNEYNIDIYELSILSALVSYFKPKMLFEFGTFDGRTTYHLALNAEEDSKVYSIDIQSGDFSFGADSKYFKEIEVGQHTKTNLLKLKIELLQGDTSKYDFSPFYNKFDFIFIDGDHSYNGVLSDSQNALKMLKKNGIIIWHDYLNIIDVSLALSEISRTSTLRHISDTSLVIHKRIE